MSILRKWKEKNRSFQATVWPSAAVERDWGKVSICSWGNGERKSGIGEKQGEIWRMLCWETLWIELVCHFKLAVDMVRDDIREFLYDWEETSIPEKGAAGIWCQSSQLCMWTGDYTCILRASNPFHKCKKHHTSYIGVGTSDWRICRHEDGVEEIGVRASEWWDGTCLAAGMVAWEGSFQGGEKDDRSWC